MPEITEIQTKKKDVIPAEVPRAAHKTVKFFANIKEKDIRDIYAEIIPMGIDAYAKKYSIVIPELN